MKRWLGLGIRSVAVGLALLPGNGCNASPLQSPPWRATVSSSRTLSVGGSSIQVDFGPGELDLRKDEVVDWVTRAARAVSMYYGQFPVPRMRVLILVVPEKAGVLQGTTWGDVSGFPAFTRMRIGQHTSAADLSEDWTMTHEMVHTAFPTMEDSHHWIEEGIATYVEPIARVQVGELQADKVWADMIRDMPKGEPGLLDRGLDHTHTWGRTYWGGAEFCLLADVTIRQRTNNRKGLQDALRGIVAAGGSIDHEWPIQRALAAGDQATGTNVLAELYDRLATKATPVDLDHIWEELGVELASEHVTYNHHAPMAAAREKMMKPLAGK